MSIQYCLSCAVVTTFTVKVTKRISRFAVNKKMSLVIYYFKIFVETIYVCDKFFENKF